MRGGRYGTGSGREGKGNVKGWQREESAKGCKDRKDRIRQGMTGNGRKGK